MSDVTVLGLGSMGSAITRELLKSGKSVTVWNRTAHKAEALVHDGANFAQSPLLAVCASAIVIVCVADYAATRAILETAGITTALRGRLIVQLSTGTPKDARDLAGWVKARGADSLDGAILATPVQLGRPDTPLFIAGAEAAYRSAEQTLRLLAGDLRFVGNDPGAAAAWDLAVQCSMWGWFLGFLHGARICEAEGLRVDALGALNLALAPVFGEMMKHEGGVIQNDDFKNAQSSVQTCIFSIDSLVQHAREAGINTEVPSFAHAIFQRAIDAGLADEEGGALIKVLRARS